MPRSSRPFQIALALLLSLLIMIGISYRFRWMDWSEGTHLHPDEYGLTNTITQLRLPDNLGDYFNTRISPLSPYQKYDEAGQVVASGPDNRMRWGQWPIILIRAVSEAAETTGYGELKMTGRYLSALADSLALLLIFLIGRRLYGPLVGLAAAALSSLAVMQIQQSHFMTADSFAVFFAALSMYFAVVIAQTVPVARPPAGPEGTPPGPYRIRWAALGGYVLFGLALGMALASRINLLPLAGMVLVAAFISAADLKLRSQRDLRAIAAAAAVFLVTAGVVTLVTFRLTQPMSFRAPQGDTTLLTLHPNPDWTDSMKVASQESSGIGGGPPSEQWADRAVIVFPLMNMVAWGMGVPLGLAVWAGFAWALWRTLRGRGWQAHLLPLVWAGGFFFFMATRWVKSVRYFLPIYPFLCLLAAWALIELFRRAHASGRGKAAYILPTLALVTVLGGALTWATAFTNVVYRDGHTRVQAARWIYQNIPAPFQLEMTGTDGAINTPVGAPDGVQIISGMPFIQPFTPQSTGRLSGVTIPHLANRAGDPVEVTIRISRDPMGEQVLDRTDLTAQPSDAARGVQAQGSFLGAELQQGETYYLMASTGSSREVSIFRNIIANEDWDEGLPMPLDGYNPFGDFYTGVTMQVRWTDTPEKRAGYYENLALVDYIILPSQRSIWSISRLPRMYPLTIEYYRALFDGRLGFEQVALFHSPWVIGPLQLSDLGGTAAWNRPPDLPRFNFNFFAAEEAFSVYDHPPVWIFQKRPDFSLEQARSVLEAVDISQAAHQSPYETQVKRIR
jgi:hypothetical protein